MKVILSSPSSSLSSFLMTCIIYIQVVSFMGPLFIMDAVRGQSTKIGLRIIMPELSNFQDNMNKINILDQTTYQKISQAGLQFSVSKLGRNPREIFNLFCSSVLPNHVNTIVYLHLKDDTKSEMLTEYMMNVINQIGLPVLSWNPNFDGAIENHQEKRILQLSPTIQQQVLGIMEVLLRFNWTHVTIVSTTGINAVEFRDGLLKLINENNDYQGYPRKPRMELLNTMIYPLKQGMRSRQQRQDMKEFLTANNMKDSRIYILHSRSRDALTIMEAAALLGLTASKYLWILTANALGKPSLTSRLPVGTFGISYRGEYASGAEEYTVTNITKNALKIWIDTMYALTTKGVSRTQLVPGLNCNDTTIGERWDFGENIYREMRIRNSSDSSNFYPLEFTGKGMNKYVHLHIFNAQPSIRRRRSKLVEVGTWSPVLQGSTKTLKMELKMKGIFWPGNKSVPPKGRPERRFFRIATLEEEPYVMYREPNKDTGLCGSSAVKCRLVYNATKHGYNDSTFVNGTVVRCCAGLSIDLLGILRERMSFDYDLFEVHDRTPGVQNEITQEWNGLIRLLVDKQADMVITNLQITPRRSQAITFSMPYLETGTTIVVSLRKGAISPTAVLEPYDYPSWCLILVFSVHSIGASIFIFEWLSPRGLDQGKTPMREHTFSLFRSFWLIWAMLFGASVSADNPRGVSSRFLANVWALFALVFLASYTANLAAFMITKTVYYDLSGIKDWRLTNPHSHKPPFKFATVPNGSTEENLRQNHPEMFSYMKKYNRPSVKEAIDALKDGDIQAFIYDATPLEYQVGIDDHCSLISVGKWYAMTGYAVGLQNGSDALAEEVNKIILDLQEFGEMDKLRKFWLSGACHKQKSGHSSTKLGILNFTSAFILLASGIVAGGLLLIFEHLYFRFGRKCLKEYDKCGCCALVSLSMGKSLTFEQSVMEAIDFTKKHRCKDPICETQLWKVKHQLDIALLRIEKLNKEIRNRDPRPRLAIKDSEEDKIGEKERELKDNYTAAQNEADNYNKTDHNEVDYNSVSENATSVPYEDVLDPGVDDHKEVEPLQSKDTPMDHIRSGDHNMRRSPSYNQAVGSNEQEQKEPGYINKEPSTQKVTFKDGKMYSSVHGEEDDGQV